MVPEKGSGAASEFGQILWRANNCRPQEHHQRRLPLSGMVACWREAVAYQLVAGDGPYEHLGAPWLDLVKNAGRCPRMVDQRIVPGSQHQRFDGGRATRPAGNRIGSPGSGT